MSIINFDPNLQLLTVTVPTDPALTAGCSNNNVFHLFRKGAISAICGRFDRRAIVGEELLRGGNRLGMCPYCLARCQNGNRKA